MHRRTDFIASCTCSYMAMSWSLQRVMKCSLSSVPRRVYISAQNKQRTSHDFMCCLAYSGLSIHQTPGDFRQQAICVGLQLRWAAPHGLTEHGQSCGCNPEVSVPCKNKLGAHGLANMLAATPGLYLAHVHSICTVRACMLNSHHDELQHVHAASGRGVGPSAAQEIADLLVS